jgi:hypothetical protein
MIKVINGNKLGWRYFCSVPTRIYHDFANIVNLQDSDMNAYLALWARRDWGLKISMGHIEDIDKLKYMIQNNNRKAYSELYIFQEYGLMPDENFWIRLWVSSHMRSETERLRIE